MSIEDLMDYACRFSTREQLDGEELVNQLKQLRSRVGQVLQSDGRIDKDIIPPWFAWIFPGNKNHRSRIVAEKHVLLPDRKSGYCPATVKLRSGFRVLPRTEFTKIDGKERLYIEVMPKREKGSGLRDISFFLPVNFDFATINTTPSVFYSNEPGKTYLIDLADCTMLNGLMDLVEKA